MYNGDCYITCPINYIPFNGKCIINNNNNTNNTNCTPSSTNPYIFNTTNNTIQCLPYCPIGYYSNANYQCIPCTAGCITCINNSTCQ